MYPESPSHIRIKPYKDFCIACDITSSKYATLNMQQAVALLLMDGTLSVDDITNYVSSFFSQAKETISPYIDDIFNEFSELIIRHPHTIPDTKIKEQRVKKFVSDIKNFSKKQTRLELSKSSSSRHLSEPFMATLLVTEKCNFDCIYCYRGGSRPCLELPEKEWDKIFHNLSDINLLVTNITGGEPFLYKWLPSIVRNITNIGSEAFLFSNGQAASPKKLLKLYDAGARYIQFSLDTLNTTIFDRISGSTGQFNKVINNIITASEIGFHVSLRMTILSLNENDVLKIIRFGERANVEQILFGYCIPVRSAPDNTLLHLNINKQKHINNSLNLLYKNYSNSVRLRLPNKGLKWKTAKDIVACGAFSSNLTINPSGDIIACDMFDHPSLRPGNLLDRDIYDIISSIKYNELKKSITKVGKHLLTEECLSCKYIEHCGTGCLKFSDFFFNNPFAPDPRCWNSSNSIADSFFGYT